MIHKEICEIHQLIGLCYSMLEKKQNNIIYKLNVYIHVCITVQLKLNTHLLCLGFRRQRCDQIYGGVFVFPVSSGVLGVFSQHGVDVAREDGRDWTLEELTEASHQVARCSAARVNV